MFTLQATKGVELAGTGLPPNADITFGYTGVYQRGPGCGSGFDFGGSIRVQTNASGSIIDPSRPDGSGASGGDSYVITPGPSVYIAGVGTWSIGGWAGQNNGTPCGGYGAWTNPTATVTFSPVAVCKMLPQLTVSNYCPQPHDISLVSGGNIFASGSVNGGTSSSPVTINVTGTFNADTTPAGTPYQWKVDGVTVGTGTVTYGQTSENGTCTDFNTSSSYTINECPASPTPTPSPSPTGSATPTPSPRLTPTPTPSGASTPPPNLAGPVGGSGGGTSSNGDVRVVNPQDIYKPITDAITQSELNRKQDMIDALKAAGDSGTDPAPLINSQFILGTQPTEISTGTVKDSFKTTSATAQQKFDGALSNGTNKIASIQSVNLPTTNVGNKKQWGVTLPVLGTMTVNIEPYMTTINLMRSLVLMIMLVGAWFATIKIIRSGIA